jgi:hypothetical protein
MDKTINGTSIIFIRFWIQTIEIHIKKKTLYAVKSFAVEISNEEWLNSRSIHENLGLGRKIEDDEKRVYMNIDAMVSLLMLAEVFPPIFDDFYLKPLIDSVFFVTTDKEGLGDVKQVDILSTSIEGRLNHIKWLISCLGKEE